MVGISPATRHATPDQSMGIPPPPRLWGHAYCRWLCRGYSGRRVPLVRRLRMGSLLPGSWGAEPRGWLLVHHYRSLLTSPSLSPRAATSPRFALPNDRRESSTRSGGRGLLGCPLRSITYASGYRLANRSERPGNSPNRRSLRTSCDGPPATSVDCSICDGAATSPVTAGCSSRRRGAVPAAGVDRSLLGPIPVAPAVPTRSRHRDRTVANAIASGASEANVNPIVRASSTARLELSGH